MLKKKDIHLKQMTIKEKIEKMVEEVKEEDIQVSKEENTDNKIVREWNIEQFYYTYLRRKDENNYRFHRNVKIWNHIYDLTDDHTSSILRRGYEMLKIKCETTDNDMPQNRSGKSKTDILLRDLDCAVIQQIHEYNSETKQPGYDSVRGVFEEGEEVYPGSALREKTHIQLCIVNPNCIKGFFSPRKVNLEYTTP